MIFHTKFLSHVSMATDMEKVRTESLLIVLYIFIRKVQVLVCYHGKYGRFERLFPLIIQSLEPKLLEEMKGLLLQSKLSLLLFLTTKKNSKFFQLCVVSGWKNFFGRYLRFLIVNYGATNRCFSFIDTSKHSPEFIFSIDTIFVPTSYNTSLWQ